MRVECGLPQHDAIKLLAWAAIIIYPIGFFVICAVLLMKARKAIVEGIETPLSRSIAFLHKEYDPICFWWGWLADPTLLHTRAPLTGRSRNPTHAAR